MRVLTFWLVASLFSAASPSVWAAGSVIGVAMANGSISLDNRRTPGNAPLFDGNTIETGKSSSHLRLKTGATVLLAANSKGMVYSKRLILDAGTSEFMGKPFEIDAKSLRVSGDSARVSVRGASVQVAALSVTVNVANSAGVVLAQLAAGRTLTFTPEAKGASGGSSLTGCLSRSGSSYLLKDETSNLTVELRGPDLGSKLGRRVSVSGSMLPAATPFQGASQVVSVSSVSMLGSGCGGGGTGQAPATDKKAATAGAGSTAAGAVAAGAFAGASTAVVAGVVVAAAVGASVGVLSTQGQSTPTQTLSTPGSPTTISPIQ